MDKEKQSLYQLGAPWKALQVVYKVVYNLLTALDEMLLFLTYFLFDRVYRFNVNYSQYSQEENCIELLKYI